MHHLVADLFRYVRSFKGTLCLREFLATGSPLKMMKNDFYFTLKTLFIFALTFWSCIKSACLERSDEF